MAIFPRSSNLLPFKIIVCPARLGPAVGAGFWYYFTPKYTRVGYEPIQPVLFSHKTHAGQLGIDCRYCHSFVEVAAHSNIPTTQVCMNCHIQVRKESPLLAPVRESWQTGRPIEWIQIHKTPDYAYFNHAAHVNRGVSCVSCHGDVTEMDVVYQHESQSMEWCIDCHRHPETALRPLEHVTNLKWKPEQQKGESLKKAQERVGRELKEKWRHSPPDINCAGCHR